MSDEILGNCYEVITEIALQDYSSVLKKGERIFAQETPVGIGIVPDIIIGKDVQKPRVLLQVHHTRAERASEKKFWRNIGEYVDARNALGATTLICTIVFDSGQKRKLSAAAAQLMDGFLEVDREPYGPELLAFAKDLETHFASHKTPEVDRSTVARKRLKSKRATVAAVQKFASRLNTLLANASKAGASWFVTYAKIQAGRPKPRVPKRKLTTVRRALGRFLPVDDEALLRKLLTSVRSGAKAPWPQYFVDLGIATKTIGESRFANPGGYGPTISRKLEEDAAYEVYRMTELFPDDSIVHLWRKLRSVTTSLSQACASIRTADEFALYHKFVVDNFGMLTTQAGMVKALRDCFDNPNRVLGKVVGLLNPDDKGVWLFDFVMTIIKAVAGKQQSYGYTRLAQEAGLKIDDKRSILDFALPKMLSRTEFPSTEVTRKFSAVLASKLDSVTKRWVTLNQAEIARFALKGQFEDKIYKTASFDPIVELICEKIPGAKLARSKRVSTFLTGYTGKGAATCDAIVHGNTAILWQASFAGHPADKHKELIGRIGMLRVKHSVAGAAVPSDVEKAVLVLDGSWQQQQMQRLADNGYDAIYYIDEIDQLAVDLGIAAVPSTRSSKNKAKK